MHHQYIPGSDARKVGGGGVEAAAIVGEHPGPHYYFIFFSQLSPLSGGNAPEGRTEQPGINHSGGPVDIFHIKSGGGGPAVGMGPGVVAC